MKGNLAVGMELLFDDNHDEDGDDDKRGLRVGDAVYLNLRGLGVL